MFKFWKIEKRRRAVVMRENMARRTFPRINPQYGLSGQLTFTNAPVILNMSQLLQWLLQPVMFQLLHLDCLHPVARIDRALDVLNAPGSIRPEFQAYFKPRNLGPGDMEELSPELWEEFRLDGAADEYDLYMQDLADEEAQGADSNLDRPPGPSEAAGPSTTREEIPIAHMPRSTLSGLEAQNPGLHKDIVIALQAMRDRDPRDPESPLIPEPEADDQLDLMEQELLLEHRPCQGLPSVKDRHQDHLAVQVDLKMWH